MHLTANFNVAATAGQGGKLVLDATIKTPAPVNAGLGATGEQDVSSNATRGNTVTVVLQVRCACQPIRLRLRWLHTSGLLFLTRALVRLPLVAAEVTST